VVNEANGTVTWTVERASFPNWDGTSRTITVHVTGDRLSQVAAPIASAGGAYVPHLEWVRAR
jgi:Lipocalin-like domain